MQPSNQHLLGNLLHIRNRDVSKADLASGLIELWSCEVIVNKGLLFSVINAFQVLEGSWAQYQGSTYLILGGQNGLPEVVILKLRSQR